MSTLLSWIRMLLAVSLLVIVYGVVGRLDYEASQVTENVVEENRAYYREFLCDCPKVNGKAWLRLHIAHQPDMKLCNAVCVYDDGSVTKGTL